MSAIDDVKRWLEIDCVQRPDYDPWEAQLLAKAIFELDERLEQIEKAIHECANELLEPPNPPDSVTTEQVQQAVKKVIKPTVTDAMHEAGVGAYMSHDKYRTLGEVVDHIFLAMWEARDD